MGMIKGTTIILHDRVQVGTDSHNLPIYRETDVQVNDVVICPVSTNDIVSETQPEGKKAVYELLLPKGCAHSFENREVSFFGARWKTVGIPMAWMAENTPGQWNRKVMVERYG